MKNTALFAFAFLTLSFICQAQKGDSKKLFALIYTPGEQWNHTIAFHEQPYFKEHSTHLQTLRKTGQIVVGGRYSDKGFLLLKAIDSVEAHQIVHRDSSVINKTFKAEIFEFSTFYSGWVGKSPRPGAKKAQLTGLGGIFIQSENPESTRKWYAEKLGVPYNKNGTPFRWRKMQNPAQTGVTYWDVFAKKDPYFNLGDQEHMINYRVNNLEAFLEELRKKGVTIIGDMEQLEFGKFAWIKDPEGRKVELWEPNARAQIDLGDGIRSN